MYNDFMKRSNRIAVVGASNNPEKWGFRLYHHLKNDGFTVFPVNPRESSIGGEKCYPDIKYIPEKPDLVITVVKPEVTEKALEDLLFLGIRKVWMQPGSESRKAVLFCKEHGIEVVYGSCYVVDGLKEEW